MSVRCGHLPGAPTEPEADVAASGSLGPAGR